MFSKCSVFYSFFPLGMDGFPLPPMTARRNLIQLFQKNYPNSLNIMIAYF